MWSQKVFVVWEHGLAGVLRATRDPRGPVVDRSTLSKTITLSLRKKKDLEEWLLFKIIKRYSVATFFCSVWIPQVLEQGHEKKIVLGPWKRPGMLDVGNPQCFVAWYLHGSTDQTTHPKSRNIALLFLNRRYLDLSLDWKSPGPFFPHLIGCLGQGMFLLSVHYAHLWRLLISRQSEMYSCISLSICHKEYDRTANPVATSYCIVSSFFSSPFFVLHIHLN